MSEELCKGGCGDKANYKGWCKIKWKSGNKFGVSCPSIERKRSKSISKFRIEEAKKGKNPMQDPVICAKNHSKERNKKCSGTLKEKGRLGLLPQQTEGKELKEKRRKNVSLSLKSLFAEGRHPRQLETKEERQKRFRKIKETLINLGKEGKLPIQKMSEEQKKVFGEKISKTLREGIKSGRIKLSKGWKRVKYKNHLLRSNWEKEVAVFLDKNEIPWEYETQRISYWDTQREVEATTIPDFFIPPLNLIIEVKSNAEYNSQKTKDKTDSIIQKGFNFILTGRKEINMIREDKNKFLKLMGVKR